MKKLLILFLAIPCLLFAAEIKQVKKVPISEKINIRVEKEIGTEEVIAQKLQEGTLTETGLRQAKEVIVKDEINKDVALFAESIKPIEIPVVRIEQLLIDINAIPYIQFVFMTPKEMKIWTERIETLGVEGLAFVITKAPEMDIPKLVILLSKLDSLSIESLSVAILKAEETDIPKLAVLISQIETLDTGKLARHLNKVYGWHIEQGEFYEAWKSRDITAIAETIKNMRMVKTVRFVKIEEKEFFLAWGNYQNFSDINWSRKEAGFGIRQVLVTSMSYDWKEKFKPQGKIILTIDFGLNSKEIHALLEMIEENREKIMMVILPWGGVEVNNYENKDVSTYQEIGEWGDRLFYAVKEVAPEIPIYLTVCWVDHTMKQWMNAFNAPYDGLALWNITNTNKAPLEKIYRVMSEYNPNVILSGLFQCQPDVFWIPWAQAKQITLDTYQRAEEAGFRGVILMGREND